MSAKPPSTTRTAAVVAAIAACLCVVLLLVDIAVGVAGYLKPAREVVLPSPPVLKST